MTAWHRWIARLRELFVGRSIDRDLAQEVHSHLDHLKDEFVRRGFAPDAARQLAAREFGSIEQTKEAIRDTRGIPVLEHLFVDVRRAVRSLAKARSFTTVAVITLALGIGVNVAIFSVLDAVVLRPLPYPGADRLVSIYEVAVGTGPARASTSGSVIGGGVGGGDDPGRTVVAPANYADYQARTKEFSGMAGLDQLTMTVTGSGTPEQVIGEEVTPNYFGVLQATPALGRLLSVDDARPGAPLVVVISHGVWHRRYGGETSVLGKSMMLDDTPHEIVGVMPREFAAVSQFGLVDPISFWAPRYYSTDLLANHGDHEINVVARLAPAVTLEAAERSLAAISDDLERRFPLTNEHLRAHVRPLGDDLVRRVRTSLVVIMSMVGLILLIACVNVANLLIVRGAGKRREVAIRYALGASRVRVASEMLVESLVLAAGAGLLGVGLATGVRGVLVALAPQNLPRLNAVGLDGRVIAFSAMIAIVSGVIFGLLPAWQTRTARPIEALGSGERTVASRWMARWRNALLVTEIAISMILLIGAGLMVKSLVSLNAVDLGFRTDHVLAMSLDLPERHYKTPDDRFRFFQTLEAQLSTVPGVVHVGYANRFPLRSGWVTSVEIDGASASNPLVFDANCQAVNPGYFDTLDLHLVRGRLLGVGDRKTAEPVAVVSQAFSTELLHGADAIGHRMRLRPTAPWVTVVGLIADIRRGGKTAAIRPQVYLSAAQTDLYPVHLADVAVQVDGRITDTAAMSAALSRAVWAVDKDQSVSSVRTLDEVVATGAKSQRFQATLVGLFAALALTLAMVGIHGVVSYVVTQRTPEIGLRMALGADRGVILRWLLRGTSPLVVIGAVAGLIGAVAFSRYVSSLLFQVTATDPVTYVSATLLISLVAMGSAALAARRATTIDPVQALRAE